MGMLVKEIRVDHGEDLPVDVRVLVGLGC
jgi:hypothetical protein